MNYFSKKQNNWIQEMMTFAHKKAVKSLKDQRSMIIDSLYASTLLVKRNKILDMMVVTYFKSYPYTSKTFRVPTKRLLSLLGNMEEHLLNKSLPRFILKNNLVKNYASLYYKKYYMTIVESLD